KRYGGPKSQALAVNNCPGFSKKFSSTPPTNLAIMFTASLCNFKEIVMTSHNNNLIIGQSGGATAVINASLVGAVEAALADGRVDGICGMLYGVEGLLKEDLIDLRRQPVDVWARLLNTPSAALGTCRYKLAEEDPERVIGILRRYDIHYLLYMGGNDSADTTHRLAQA